MAGAEPSGDGSSPAAPSTPTEALLRLAAVGAVDDGKSTLIGRLLYDLGQLPDDQLEAIAVASRRRGTGGRGTAGMDLSFVTDGLRAERDQGITIDVAYRYARTARRKLVIADCPGHSEYTRNMATGASTADLILLLVDVSIGLREQTRRHLCIAALFGVKSLVVAINKMDLIGWSQGPYSALEAEIGDLARRLKIPSFQVVPVSALLGDNVVSRSARASWYSGPTIVEALEAAPVGTWAALPATSARLPVQLTLKHSGGGRSHAGMMAGGTIRVGDEIVVLPQGHRSEIVAIETFDGPLTQGQPLQSVSVRLADEVDVGRGDLIAGASAPPAVTRAPVATVCWFSETPLRQGAHYRLKQTTRTTRARVTDLQGRLNLSSLQMEGASELKMNEIGAVEFTLDGPIAADPYRLNRVTGSFILISETSNSTVGAGMVGSPDLGQA